MNEEELIVLRAQAQHAKPEDEEEGPSGDKRPMAELVKEGSGEASEAKGEEGLGRRYPRDLAFRIVDEECRPVQCLECADTSCNPEPAEDCPECACNN